MVYQAVKYLPYNKDLGYDQRQRVKINAVAYDLFYRWNRIGVFVTLEIVTVSDGATLWIGKLQEYWPISIKDSITGKELFVIYPVSLSETQAKVQVYFD